MLLKKTNYLSAYEEGFLRHTLVDGQRAGGRGRDKVKGAIPNCAYCNSDVVESAEHLFWHCTTWEQARMPYDGALLAFSEDWPPCLKSCGILPTVRSHVVKSLRSNGERAVAWDCSNVTKRTLWQVQRMMVAVVAARHRVMAEDGLVQRRERNAYPFEFQPVATHQVANTLRTRTPAGWRQLYLGDTVRMALSWYLAGLQWGQGAEFSVIEMAVHFVVTTGCDLIALEDGATDDGTAMMRRDKALRMALQALPSGETPKLGRSRWLYRLGGPRTARLTFPVRPLIDARTTEALRRLGTCMSEATLACEAVSRVVEDRSEVRETAPPILLRSDGAARRNGKKVKGTSGIGFAAWREGEEVMAFHARLPDGSSNMVAEYWAAIAAMRWLLAEARADGRTLAATAVFDCETMVDQIRGGVAARSVGCAPLRKIAAGLVAELYRFGGFAFRHEARESNCRADKLANIGASETEVTSSWPAWWTVEHTTAQVGTSLSADGSHGGWMGKFCLSEFKGRPSVRPWEAWLDDLDGPACEGGKAEKLRLRRQADRDRRATAARRIRAGDPEAPA